MIRIGKGAAIGYVVFFALYSTVLRNLPWPPLHWFHIPDLTPSHHPRERPSPTGGGDGNGHSMDTTVTGKETDMQPYLRVSDAERQHVVDVLRRHTSEGRLTLDEFETRVDAAQRAVTRADLAVVTADLPQPPAATPAVRRPLVVGLVVAGIVVALLLVAAIVAGLAGWGHMGPMMGGCCR